MRKLVPYLVAAATFALVAVVTPGLAGAQEGVATAACEPFPQCSVPPVPGTVDFVGLVVNSIDRYGEPFSEEAATAGDVVDDAGVAWSSCIVSNGALAGFQVVDYADSSSAAGAVNAATLCRRPASHGGVTYYKQYGTMPDRSAGYYASGNYTHKYDHENNVRHCGGWNDDDCSNRVYMTNKQGTRVFADNICGGRGYCPNASFTSRPAGRPFCGVAATGHQGKVRNECWYVY